MKLERVTIDGKEYFVISEAEMAKERMEKRNTGSAEEKDDSPISRFNQSVSGGAKKLLSDIGAVGSKAAESTLATFKALGEQGRDCLGKAFGAISRGCATLSDKLLCKCEIEADNEIR